MLFARVAGMGVAAIGVAALGAVRAQEPGQQPGNTGVRPGDQPLPAPPQESATTFVRGQLVSRYWLRWTGGTHDQDVYETLTLDLGKEDQNAVTGHLLGRLAADIDGHSGGSSPFFSLQDTRNGAVDVQLYDAYADLHRIDGLELVRAGRQTIEETPELMYFDGVHCRTRPAAAGELQFGAYGGVSTHLYESSPQGDWTAGVYGECRPWGGGRLRLDWMHLEDEVLLGAHKDDLLGAGIWQTIDSVQLEAQYTRLEGRDRDVRARASWADTDSRFTGQLTWYQLLTAQRSQVLELDPFFNALHDLFPYWQLGALLGKGVGDHLDLDAGTDVRRVSDRADVGTFNRDYDRWYVTLNAHDLLASGLTLTATADFWHSAEQDVQTWAGEVSQRCSDLLTLSVGSYYSLYKFELFLNDERDHVRTYYARVRHKASQAIALDLDYEFERTDLADFQTLRMGVTWRF
jgi:hypothetical protein